MSQLAQLLEAPAEPPPDDATGLVALGVLGGLALIAAQGVSGAASPFQAVLAPPAGGWPDAILIPLRRVCPTAARDSWLAVRRRE